MTAKAHLAQALHWSAQAPVGPAEILAAALGMAVPLALGAAQGKLAFGLAAALGSLALGAAQPGRPFRPRDLALALAQAVLAAVAGALALGHGWLSDAALLALACGAATIGGYSRPLAIAALRFVLFLIIVVNAAETAPNRGGLLLLIAAGALWTALLRLAFGALLSRPPAATLDAGPAPATAAQRLARWQRSLAQLRGWQYTLRLGLCLAAALGLRALWPEHHFYWIALTVALLLQRQIEIVSVRTTQRTLGTALGVFAASLFVAQSPPVWGLALCVGLLAGARPLLRARNYLAYSAVMAPLVMLLLDAGGPFRAGLLVDRLIATLLGAALVVAVNFAFAKLPGTGAQA